MVVPAIYEAASSGNDILEGASVNTDLQNAHIKCRCGIRLLQIVVLSEAQLCACNVGERRRVYPVIQKIVWIQREQRVRQTVSNWSWHTRIGCYPEWEAAIV